MSLTDPKLTEEDQKIIMISGTNTSDTLTDSRPEDYTAKWLETVNCPVIHVDGILPVQQNVDYLVSALEQCGDTV